MLAITTETFLYAKAVNSCKDETLTCLPNDYTMQMFKILAAEEHTTVKKQTNKKKAMCMGRSRHFSLDLYHMLVNPIAVLGGLSQTD